MWKTVLLFKVFFLFCFASFANISAPGQAFIVDGKVVEVFDGETITVQNRKKVRHTIRLAGIDAPLTSQPFGEQARVYLSGLIMHKSVKVRGTRFDDQGMLRGKVLFNGRDVNLELIIAGLAWHRAEIAGEQSERDRQLYESAEFHARRSKFNLWSDSKPVTVAKVEPTKEPAKQQSATAEQAAKQSSPTVPLRTLANPSAPSTAPAAASAAAVKIIGNRNSKIYHWSGCPGFTKVAEQNQVPFNSTAEAETAGYRAARNCSSPKP